MSVALWLLLAASVVGEVLLARLGLLARFTKLSPWFTGAGRGAVALAAAGAGSATVGVVVAIAVVAIARLATAYGVGVLQPRMRQSVVGVRVADSYFDGFRMADYTSRRFAPIVPVLSGLSWIVDLALGGFGAFGGTTPSLGPVAGVAAVVATVEAGIHIAALLRWPRLQRDALTAIAAELETLAPRVVLYSAALPETVGNVEQWIPALEGSGEQAYIVVRELGMVAALAEVTALPIVYMKSIGGLEDLVPESVEVALYVDTSLRNNHLLRIVDLVQVQLHHGDSDKASSSSRLLRMYDHHFVAGPAAVTRLVASGVIRRADQATVIGRPIASGLERRAINRAEPTILYAPTWEGFHRDTDLSSLPMGVAIVSRLLAYPGARTLVRPHPFSGRIDKSTAAVVDQLRSLVSGHAGAEISTEPSGAAAVVALDRADVLVTDVSSMLSDFLYTGRPALVVDVADLGRDALIERYPTVAAAYVVRSDLSDLEDKIELALGDDPQHQARGEVGRRVLGDLDGPTDGFAAALARLGS